MQVSVAPGKFCMFQFGACKSPLDHVEGISERLGVAILRVTAGWLPKKPLCPHHQPTTNHPQPTTNHPQPSLAIIDHNFTPLPSLLAITSQAPLGFPSLLQMLGGQLTQRFPVARPHASDIAEVQPWSLVGS